MENQAKFTPGPWTVGIESVTGRHFNASNVYDQNGDGIAQVYGVPLHATLEELRLSGNAGDSEGLANASLIATAPDLYALLVESQTSIGGDWRARRDAILAKAVSR